MRVRHYLPETALTGGLWLLLPATRMALAAANEEHTQWIDKTWPLERRERGWSWNEVRIHSHECFVLLDPAGEPSAAWCTNARRHLLLPPREAPHYRLDFIEVRPTYRGSGLGHLTMAIVAARALESGAVGLVLGAVPLAVTFYDHLGGVRGSVKGWNEPPGLVPYTFPRAALLRLKDWADALHEEGQTPG